MAKLKNYVSRKHNLVIRNYIKRMINEKVNCMKISKKFSYDYWDGDRKYGYGGYKFIDGYWRPLAKKLIKNYKLSNSSSLIDIGCGKAYLLYEIKKILPKIRLIGLDISRYAIKNSHKNIKKDLINFDARKKLPFKNKEFDLAISLGTYHNFELDELKISLSEIRRVSKKSYVMVESYRNNQELFNLQCWALTANSFFSKKEWVWLYKEFKYDGDYEFIYFKNPKN